MFGGAYGVQIWDDEEKHKHLRVEYNSHSQYLFQKKQTRSFDLKNKPWSRYMEVYANEDQAREAKAITNFSRATNFATPGINVFTQKVDVTPGFSTNFNTALTYRSKGFDGEVGYNFFVRRSECVKLTCPWKEGPALKHSLGFGMTNPIRDITGNKFLEQQVVGNTVALTDNGNLIPPADGADDEIDISRSDIFIPVVVDFYEQSLIKEKDLDLQSAATPCMLIHTVYGALGYRWDDREYPVFLTYGGSYTFSRNNNAVPQRWTIWGKFGFSF